MGNLTLNGSTSGAITISPPAIAGTNTITLPAATGTMALTASPTFSGTLTATTITSPASTALTIQSAGTTAMTVDTSQNVGIGTTSPQSALNVVRSSSSTTIGGSTAIAQIGNSNGGSTGLTAGLELFGSGAPSAGNGNRSGGIYGIYESYNASGNAGALAFATNSAGGTSVTERMRIDSSGNLLVGTTSAGTTTGIVVNKSASGTGGVGYFYNNRNVSGDYCAVFAMDSNTNNTSSVFLQCTNPGVANRFTIYGNGTYATVSDINLKKNIETARDGYLDDICALHVIKYNWNTQADEEPKELGFIAQEFESVFPSLVQNSEVDGAELSYKQIKTSVIPFILVKAIQELSAKNDALEARLAALETK